MKISESKGTFQQIGDVIGVLMFAALGIYLAVGRNTDAAWLCMCILYMIAVDQGRLRKTSLIADLGNSMLRRLDRYSTGAQIEARKDAFRDYDFMRESK